MISNKKRDQILSNDKTVVINDNMSVFNGTLYVHEPINIDDIDKVIDQISKSLSIEKDTF